MKICFEMNHGGFWRRFTFNKYKYNYLIVNLIKIRKLFLSLFINIIIIKKQDNFHKDNITLFNNKHNLLLPNILAFDEAYKNRAFLHFRKYINR